jgi:hypothetical protein
MARFLSSAWFDEVARHSPRPANADDAPNLVLRQVVNDSPDGDIAYHVVVESGAARIEPPGRDPGPADLTLTTTWETAVGIAQGKLAAQAALVEGRLRVKGNLAVIAGQAAAIAGLDAVPPEVRDRTTY